MFQFSINNFERKIFLLLMLILFIHLLLSSPTKPTLKEEKSFLKWMRNTNQIYVGDSYFFRMHNFINTVDQINKHNKDSSHYKLAPNQYSHLTGSELHSIFAFKDYKPHPRSAPRFSDFVPPESLDWRQNNTVSSVKNQLTCGSCWSFSSVAVVESLLARTEGSCVSLSAQSLVDCCTLCNGCLGCDPAIALDWIIYNSTGCLPLEASYPYFARQMQCDTTKFINSTRINLKAWDYVDFCNETDLMVKCAEYGPVLSVMKANLWSFIYYTGGIFYEEGCSQFDYDHGVVVVGYGNENDQLFWIVKNSMGKEWGEEGYIRLARNKGNMCGIATRSIYVSDKPLSN